MWVPDDHDGARADPGVKGEGRPTRVVVFDVDVDVDVDRRGR